MKLAKDYFHWQASRLEQEYRGAVIENHNLDTGINREDIVRKWLLEHLPRSVTPEVGGKIIDETGYKSEQIDLVVYNNALPRFGANEKSYYFAEGAITAVQVKSKLTSQELTNAVKNLASVKKCNVQAAGFTHGGPRTTVPTLLFAFERDEKDFPSNDKVIEALKRREADGLPPIDFVYINRQAYIVYNRGEWYSDFANEETKKEMPKGYLLIEQSESSIWRMVLAISSEASRDISNNFDFQKYFIEAMPSSTAPTDTSSTPSKS